MGPLSDRALFSKEKNGMMELQKKGEKKMKITKNYVPFITADFRAYLHCMQDGDYGLAMAMAEQAAEKSLKGILECYTDLPPYQQKSNCCAFLLTECQRYGVETTLDENDMFYLSKGYIGGRYPRDVEYSFRDALKAGAIAENAMLLLHKNHPSEQIAAILDYSEPEDGDCHVRLRQEVRLYMQITGSENPYELYEAPVAS